MPVPSGAIPVYQGGIMILNDCSVIILSPMIPKESYKLEVIVRCNEIYSKIMRFKLDEKVYVVSDSANMWKEKDEQDITRFIVICEKQNAIGELCFHHSTQKWEVVRLESLDE
jgi:hypothetical protein